MFEFDLFENLIDFIDELYLLLKEDWIKFKLFVKENKNYILWLFIALITLQFTDIINLGSSWNRYCKKNNIQNGGGNGNANISKTQGTSESENPKTPEEQAKADKKEKKDKLVGEEKQKILDKRAEKKAEKKAEKEAKKAESTDGGPDGEDSVKGVEKKLGLFNKITGKIKDSAGQHGLAGPVLGNLEGVFGAVGGMFTFAAAILIFVGILSLPVLIFLILTYCVIKMMVGKLAIY